MLSVKNPGQLTLFEPVSNVVRTAVTYSICFTDVRALAQTHYKSLTKELQTIRS